MPDDKADALLWRERATSAFASAQRLYVSKDFWGCANRAYYAAYQACSALCIAHGDRDRFPDGRNNPSHEQLPDLISGVGDIAVGTRRQVRTNLAYLRNAREDADYRIGITVDDETGRRCLRFAGNIFTLLKTNEE